MKQVSYILPSYWASYLINGDGSGLEPAEKEEIDEFLKTEELPAPIDYDDMGFVRGNDANMTAGEVSEYYFLIN